jgi:hypothetical protein
LGCIHKVHYAGRGRQVPSCQFAQSMIDPRNGWVNIDLHKTEP